METFSPLATSITVEFDCPKCGNHIELIIDEIPLANMAGEHVRECENSEEGYFSCDKCGAEFTYVIYVNMYEAKIEIKDEDGDDVDFDIAEIDSDNEDPEYDESYDDEENLEE